MKKLLSVLACVFLLSGTAYGGLVAHWSFNNEADVGFDESGSAHHAVPNSSIPWINGALHFSGDDYLEASISPAVLEAYTICVRFKSSYSLKQDLTYLITRGTDTQYDNFFLRWAGSGRMCGGHETTAGDMKVNTDPEPTSKLNNGKWQELWLTYDGIKSRIYRNGILDATENVVPPDDSGDEAPVRIGARNPATDPDHWFKGYVDDVKIYNEALTPPTIELISAYIDYGFGANRCHFYPRDLMRLNMVYDIAGGDPDGQYKVVGVGFAKYPVQRNCRRRKQRNKAVDIVGPGEHTLQFLREVPSCAEPPAVYWTNGIYVYLVDWIKVKWTVKLTTKLTKEDRTVVLDRAILFTDDAFAVHNPDDVYKGY
jgi:hypothetical protein